jgi:hypothetical protein
LNPSIASGRATGLARIDALSQAIRSSLSPCFLPDEIIEVSAIPRTLSSKKQALPAKHPFEGRTLAEVVDLSAMTNPDAMQDFVKLATDFRAGTRPLRRSPEEGSMPFTPTVAEQLVVLKHVVGLVTSFPLTPYPRRRIIFRKWSLN